MEIIRLDTNPIVTPDMLAGDDGANINGPSLIRTPNWLPDRLGRYYLYFAHHGGQYIRLAFADDLAGPWSIHPGGTLGLSQAPCDYHIASPDVHVDHERRQIRMYYHGVVCDETAKPTAQCTFVATSKDGLHFESRPQILGPSYFRVFQWQGAFYASTFGQIGRSPDGIEPFEMGQQILPPINESVRTRHTAVQIRGDRLRVFFSRMGDEPERILMAWIDLSADWRQWTATQPVEAIGPETEYEGGDLRIEPSVRGLASGRVRQLRDPAIYEEDGRTYLLYSIAGESGIAIAEVLD